MKIIRLTGSAAQLANNSENRFTVLTMGVFDGFHLGHQSLVEKVNILAKTANTAGFQERALLTFEPMPQEYFSKSSTSRLMSLVQKAHYLSANNLIDVLYVMRFSSQLAQQTPEHFLAYIMKAIAPKTIVIGDDFRFGHKAQGNADFLRTQSKYYGFEVVEMPSFLDTTKERISSSAIRTFLSQNDFKNAQKFLGRPYSIYSKVIYGHQLARTLGFPTINLKLQHKVLPLQGVFVVKVKFDGEDTYYNGVANIGYRPTISEKKPILEVHIFDFNKMVYGACCEVEFCAKIRDEVKFASLDDLKNAIQQDVSNAQLYFKEHE